MEALANYSLGVQKSFSSMTEEVSNLPNPETKPVEKTNMLSKIKDVFVPKKPNLYLPEKKGKGYDIGDMYNQDKILSSSNYFLDEQKKLDTLIAKLRESNYKFKDTILNQLFHWMNVISEEEEEDLDIDLKSLENLKNFIGNEILNNFSTPRLILASEGTLRLEWLVERDKKFLGVRFLSKGLFTYVLFSPSSEDESFINRTSGMCDKKELDKIIKNINWI